MILHANQALIGASEVIQNLIGKIVFSQNEIEYLLNSVNDRLKDKIKPSDVFNTYTGIYPIVNLGQKIANVSSEN